MTRDHRVTDHDALSEFASEPVPPPATSELDALIDAASAGAPAAFPTEAGDRSVPSRTTTNARWRWSLGVSLQPVVVRWVAAPLAAFVGGATLVAWGLRTLEPGAPSIARATPPADVVDSRVATAGQTPPQLLPAALVEAPPVRVPVIESKLALAVPTSGDPQSAAVAVATVTASHAPQAAPPVAATTARPAGPTPAHDAVREPLSATASARAAAPAALPPAARAALPRSAPAPRVLPPPAVAAFDPRAVLPSTIAEPPPVLPAVKTVEIAAEEAARLASAGASTPARAIVDERAVREALDHYADAIAGMDVPATAAVWPSVDRRALTRAFATLKSQDLTFESCHINVNDMSATAHCRGTVKFVRKIGNPTPLTAPQEWRFVMRKFGATWTIDEVTATPGAMTSARANEF